MNRHSISFKLSLLFGAMALLLVALFIFSLQLIDDRLKLEFGKRMRINSEQIAVKFGEMQEGEHARLKHSDLELIKDENLSNKIVTFGEKFDKPMLGHPHKEDEPHHALERPLFEPRGTRLGGRIAPYSYEGDRYIVIMSKDGLRAVKDLRDGEELTLFSVAIFGGLLGSLTLLFIAVLKSLSPLKKLRDKIREFGEGNLHITSGMSRRDEVGQIASEFDKAAGRIRELVESRELFLKNAAHELKTPIAKGMLTAHLIEDEKQSKRLVTVFSRLNEIVQHLLEVEELNSGTLAVQLGCFSFSEVIDDAASALFLEKDSFQMAGSDIQIEADFRLFTTALKNLLDNAMKFGEAGSVVVSCDDGVVSVKSRGEPLMMPFEKLLEPFHKETSERNKDGMGLGLYITKKMLEAQGWQLGYRRESDFNVFYASCAKDKTTTV